MYTVFCVGTQNFEYRQIEKRLKYASIHSNYTSTSQLQSVALASKALEVAALASSYYQQQPRNLVEWKHQPSFAKTQGVAPFNILSLSPGKYCTTTSAFDADDVTYRYKLDQLDYQTSSSWQQHWQQLIVSVPGNHHSRNRKSYKKASIYSSAPRFLTSLHHDHIAAVF